MSVDEDGKRDKENGTLHATQTYTAFPTQTYPAFLFLIFEADFLMKFNRIRIGPIL